MRTQGCRLGVRTLRVALVAGALALGGAPLARAAAQCAM
jgi:hypothetical protein